MKRLISRWTTEISLAKSVAEITQMLTDAQAMAILTELAQGKPTAISFRIRTSWGVMSFRLPAETDAVHQILSKRDRTGRHAIAPRYRTREQAKRTAWRVVRDWLEAQLALIECGLARLEQVFLPYAQNDRGETVYERLKAEKFSGLLLTGGS